MGKGSIVTTWRAVTAAGVALTACHHQQEADVERAAVPDVPILDIRAAPLRIWVERTRDGTVGRIRLTGHAPGAIGERVTQILKEGNIDGFVSYGVAEIRSIASANYLFKTFSDLADDYPHFVEMREVTSWEPDPGPAEGSTAKVRFRALDTGPAFIPMRTTEGAEVWRTPEPGAAVLADHTVLSGSDEGPAWRALVDLFKADCAADPQAGNFFFKVRERDGGSYDVSCVYVVAGPYLEQKDANRHLITITTPTRPQSPHGAEADR